MDHREQCIVFLENLLSRGDLQSQYEQYVKDNIISPPNPDSSFYPEVLAKHGESAAQEALADWEAEYRMHDFSTAIEPIAAGMLQVIRAEAENQHAHLVTYKNEMKFPRIPLVKNHLETLVFFNPSLPGCACVQPRGARIFGRDYGCLVLHAITLQTAVDSNGEYAIRLGLVMPRRGFANTIGKNEFAILTIEPNGSIYFYTFKPTVNIDDYLRLLLELPLNNTPGFWAKLWSRFWSGRSHTRCAMSDGGSVDFVLGFPGAHNYVANHIAKLGPYLTEAAHRLTCEHSH